MGFFRFRRSIKLFPGVRWNIGKKSTSLSVGPRGAHVTMGTAGSRTAVGIPGTGLSYINVSKAHTHVANNSPGAANIPIPSASWIASQHGTITLNLPDRLPEEPSIRPDQIAELNSLGHVGSTGFDPKSLGSDQAANVILQLKEAQKEYSKKILKHYYADHGHAVSDAFINHAYDHPGTPYQAPKKWGCGTWIAIGIVLWVVISLLAK
jgi:hypothetical protein